MTNRIVAAASGTVFAVGLALAGMTRPSNVRAFLDVSGDWDPSLALVMVGAIAVYAVAYWWTRHFAKPLFDAQFFKPQATHIDLRLVAGATLFGVGWGLAGYCPGPAVASLGTGLLQPALFVAAMVTGFLLARVRVLRG